MANPSASLQPLAEMAGGDNLIGTLNTVESSLPSSTAEGFSRLRQAESITPVVELAYNPNMSAQMHELLEPLPESTIPPTE